jgi:cytochrome-b5 reductase
LIAAHHSNTMSLFVASRSAFRAAAPIQRSLQTRRYATETVSKSSASTLALLAGAAGLAGAGSYYFLSGTPAAKKAEAKVKETASAAADKASSVTPGVTRKALTGGDQGFVSLEVKEVETVSHNTKRVRFALPEDDMVSGLHIASAVLTKFKPEGAEKPVLRPYTPVSDEDARGYVDLLVKKYPNGPMSTHIHSLAPGDKLDIKGPLPKYPWSANKHQHIGLIAGGTGITPMWQLVRAIFNNPEDKTKVTLVFGNLTEEDILLKKELAELENTYPQRFRAFYTLDNPPKEWQGGKGVIGKELLKTVLPEPKTENIKVFVCGPPGMMNAISGNKKSPRDQGELVGVLKELGYTSEQVYKF